MSQAGPRTGVAVIGLGNAFIPHALALKDLAATVEVVWAASPSPARTARVAAEHGFPVTNDIQQAIADPRVFAVLLLAPPDVHLDIARSCFAAGKHVLCEKPLDVSLARAEALVAEAAHAGLTLGAVLQSRFRADALRLKQVLDAGGLGAVQAASLAVPWWRPQAYYDEPGRGTYARDGGGVLITQAIHAIDMMRFLVGIASVDAARTATTALHRMEAEDFAAALVSLGNGAPGSIVATTAAFPGGPEQLTIIGAAGTARLSGGVVEIAWLDGRTERAGSPGGSGGGAQVMAFPHEMHRELIADFLAAARAGRAPAASGAELLASQAVIHAIMGRATRR
jgi:predicted dehydrogenase